MTKHSKDTDKLKSPDIRKIPIDDIKIIYKNYNKSRLQILDGITIKKFFLNIINKRAFNTAIKHIKHIQ